MGESILTKSKRQIYAEDELRFGAIDYEKSDQTRFADPRYHLFLD